MRALVTRLLPDNRREKVLVTDWPEPPAPTGSQIKIQTLYSGVTNGTERNDLTGGNYANRDEDLPRGWGYQNVGRVVETGPDAHRFAIGDLVYSSSDHMEFITRPEDSLVTRVPDSVDPVHAALSGMASVALHTCRNASIRTGEQVLVVGAGFIGQVAAQLADLMGGHVTLCDIDDTRLALAGQVGAAEYIVNTSGTGWDTMLAERRFDVVIDLAGVPGMEPQLVDAVRHSGRLLFIAGRHTITYPFNQGQGREITIKQNSHFTQSDLDELMRLLARGRVTFAPFIHDVVPVTAADDIYRRLRDTPNTLFGTVFQW